MWNIFKFWMIFSNASNLLENLVLTFKGCLCSLYNLYFLISISYLINCYLFTYFHVIVHFLKIALFGSWLTYTCPKRVQNITSKRSHFLWNSLFATVLWNYSYALWVPIAIQLISFSLCDLSNLRYF